MQGVCVAWGVAMSETAVRTWHRNKGEEPVHLYRLVAC